MRVSSRSECARERWLLIMTSHFWSFLFELLHKLYAVRCCRRWRCRVARMGKWSEWFYLRFFLLDIVVVVGNLLPLTCQSSYFGLIMNMDWGRGSIYWRCLCIFWVSLLTGSFGAMHPINSNWSRPISQSPSMFGWALSPLNWKLCNW